MGLGTEIVGFVILTEKRNLCEHSPSDGCWDPDASLSTIAKELHIEVERLVFLMA